MRSSHELQVKRRSARARMSAVSGLAIALTGCGEGERGPLDDWSAGYEGPIAPSTEPGPVTGPLELIPADDVGVEMRLTRRGTNEPCALGFDGNLENYRAIDCVLDIAEGDLRYSGLHFSLNVPAGACDYVVWNHYMYMNWEVGTPDPPDVTIVKDPDTGNILSEENAIDGEPTCVYDYSDAGGPNCCVGEYTVTVTTGADVNVVGPKKWGGRAANCFTGAAYFDPDAEITEEGWPSFRYVQLEKQAYFKRFTFDPLAGIGRTNLTYANYFDPADHDGATPAGLGGNAFLNAPANFEYSVYKFSCVDTAKEHFSDIRMVVREWNTEAEFNKGNDGNPDVEGEEVAGYPNDDYDDWKTATPGSTMYIEDKF